MSMENFIERAGACRFCGQIGIIKINPDATEEEQDEEATYRCQCDTAKEYAGRKDRIVYAQAKIVEIFGSDEFEASEAGVEIMKKCAEEIGFKRMKSLKIDFGNGTTGTINGNLKVKMTHKVSVESGG